MSPLFGCLDILDLFNIPKTFFDWHTSARMAQDAHSADSQQSEAVARLEEAARERWGSAWYLETREWTDGDVQRRVIHRRGRVEDGEQIEQDELMLDGEDGVVARRVRVPAQRGAVVSENI